jgi:hypothetical protein
MSLATEISNMRENANAYFVRFGATVVEFERFDYRFINRYEVIISTADGRMQVWAWDSSHGGGFWHQIG